MMRNPLSSFFTVIALFLGIAQDAEATTRPIVLELFTSEGCSSCPPAENLVNELAQRPDVLALSFHVDYWDELGWRDIYSLSSATERQRQYAYSLHSSVYTPQMLIDGSRDVVGSDRASIAQALLGQRQSIETTVDVSDNGEMHISVGGGAKRVPAEILLVGYLRRATTHIGRGENSGRTVMEANIVRAMRVLGPWSGEPQEFRIRTDGLSADITDVAVLVQSAHQGVILGAAAHPLVR